MVILHFNPTQFFDYLKENGCSKDPLTDKYIEENVVIFSKDGFKMPIQLRTQYYPSYVCRVCDQFRIPPPKEFEKVKNQLDTILNKEKNGDK